MSLFSSITKLFILFENLFKPRQLYLQPQNSVLSNLRLAS
ncbi:DNA alkylation repair protein [Streptococcus pseudopneumoniae]|uniref:DNA alkylation repair protein n=1 Tax=Streptococcus pseudopneumoniae TaxID=257758 RepID=A0A3A4X0T5_9STRE|nr:DNA alkylation repair protein [Streptococcus pseudopneumoniae]TAA68150.1 DNA alkylation repair protein [Streptococcus sp. LQJ-218]NIB75727.1 DNA alkylation repair protein [Streptococcus pseudopneumoniae]NIB77807.1 DNA alkylation repair protein [Streptococcus pseudopneumoniae]NIB82411.1 DNA alkylation repair protein [Streptococcus pseudopneumoniae]